MRFVESESENPIGFYFLGEQGAKSKILIFETGCFWRNVFCDHLLVKI